jgi:hypothetical protein
MKKRSEIIRACLATTLLCAALIFSGCAAAGSGSAQNASASGAPGSSLQSTSGTAAPGSASGGGESKIAAAAVDGFSVTAGGLTLKCGDKISDLLKTGFRLMHSVNEDPIAPNETAALNLESGDTVIGVTVINNTKDTLNREDGIVTGFAIVRSAVAKTAAVTTSVAGLTPDMSLADFEGVFGKPQSSADIVKDGDTDSYTYHGSTATNASLTVQFSKSQITEIDYSIKTAN